ncbi:hypothetical protein Vadar_024777 [Vaccinium darrowii]|uniref:Uncharacterized protein n=1 Tax=Vaccinium darrowii TaxID=229202 RepID=A0ACB7XL03_9ERIC|nr:hypothetical protein Vadar_024777 [Vaccinium darrowii]
MASNNKVKRGSEKFRHPLIVQSGLYPWRSSSPDGVHLADAEVQRFLKRGSDSSTGVVAWGSGLLSPGDGNFTTNIKQGGLRRRAQFTHGDTVFLGVMFQMTVLKGFKNVKEKVGVGIVKRALSYPVKLIAKNPGVNGSVLSDKVFSFNYQNCIYGYRSMASTKAIFQLLASFEEYEDVFIYREANTVVDELASFQHFLGHKEILDRVAVSVAHADMLGTLRFRIPPGITFSISLTWFGCVDLAAADERFSGWIEKLSCDFVAWMFFVSGLCFDQVFNRKKKPICCGFPLWCFLGYETTHQ